MEKIKRGTLLLIALLISFVSLFGCRGDNKSSSGHNLELQEDHLIVELELKVQEDDILGIYYRNEDEKYSKEQLILTNVLGFKDFQKVIFVFDQLVFPSHILIDFGENENQGEILLRQLVFKYNDEEHVFSHQEIKKYFKPNSGFQFSFDSMAGKGVIVNGKYDPKLSSYNISYFVNKLILY